MNPWDRPQDPRLGPLWTIWIKFVISHHRFLITMWLSRALLLFNNDQQLYYPYKLQTLESTQVTGVKIVINYETTQRDLLWHHKLKGSTLLSVVPSDTRVIAKLCQVVNVFRQWNCQQKRMLRTKYRMCSIAHTTHLLFVRIRSCCSTFVNLVNLLKYGTKTFLMT